MVKMFAERQDFMSPVTLLNKKLLEFFFQKSKVCLKKLNEPNKVLETEFDWKYGLSAPIVFKST